MTEIDTKRLRELLASARVLPWENGEGDPESILCTADYACVAVSNAAFTDFEDNARLIVAAVNALPELLAVYEAVQEAPEVVVEPDGRLDVWLDGMGGQSVRLVRSGRGGDES